MFCRELSPHPEERRSRVSKDEAETGQSPDRLGPHGARRTAFLALRGKLDGRESVAQSPPMAALISRAMAAIAGP